MVLLDQGGAVPDHQARLLAAPDDLRRIVEHLSIHAYPPSTATREWRIVPDASAHLLASVINGPDGQRLRAMFVGPRSHVAIVDARHRSVTIAIRLKPGAIRALLPNSAAEFVDRAVPLRDAFNSRALCDLELAPDAPASLLAAELVRIVRRAARDPQPARIAESLERVCRVRDIAEAAGVSDRTAREHAIRDIGLSAKRALRIMRLHSALLAARRRELSWATIAHLTGYADQAHLTRECRALLGDPPSRWIARGTADSFKTPTPRLF